MDWQVLTGSRLADAAAGGLIVLAAGSLAARLCRQPVRRARLDRADAPRRHGGPRPGSPAGRPAVVGRPPRGAGRDPRSRRPCGPRRGGSRPAPARGGRIASRPRAHRAARRNADGPRPDRTRPRSLRAGGLRARGPVASPLRADGPARELFRGGGRVGGLVARRAGPALARDPVGSTGPGGDPRRLPRTRRARGRAGRAARERPDRLAVHLHLGPSGDPAARRRSATGASPGPSGTSWRTSGRTSRGATPGRGTSPAWRGSSSSISPCSGG